MAHRKFAFGPGQLKTPVANADAIAMASQSLRLRGLLLTTGLTLSTLGCSSSSSEEVVVNLTGPCANPTIHVDGRTWETHDTNPEWNGLDSIQGMLEIDGDSAVLTAKDGTLFDYTTTANFSAMRCIIG